jgi:hypothetical protein
MSVDAFAIFIFISIHLVLSLCYLLLPSARTHTRKEYIIPILFIPLFGPLMAITIEILFLIQDPGKKQIDLETLRDENDMFWSSFLAAKEDKDAIPLEEAVLLNDIPTRRNAVLKTFQGDSFRYIDVLMVARNNEDVDTTHYATIQISKIQRQFQLKLQQYAAEVTADPQNLAVLDEYIDLLGTYLHSPLPEKSILRHQRKVYANLLDQKLVLLANDQETLVKKLRINTEIREDYPAALRVMDLLKENWPAEEQTWIETLRACIEWEDTDRVRETINGMKTQKIHWTKWGREQVSPWVRL